jgi:PPOX class probable F420-dependent enzyme
MKVPAVLATIGSSGGPVTSSVWYGVHGDDVVVSTLAAGTKARRVRADPRVSVLIDTKDRPYRGVAIEGFGQVCPDPGLEAWMMIARRYLGPVLPATLLARGQAGDRAVIRSRPRRVRPWNL